MIASDNTVSGTFIYGSAYQRGFVRGRRFIVGKLNATFFDTLSSAMTVRNGLLDKINWTIHHSSALTLAPQRRTHTHTDAQTHACTTNTTVTINIDAHHSVYIRYCCWFDRPTFLYSVHLHSCFIYPYFFVFSVVLAISLRLVVLCRRMHIEQRECHYVRAYLYHCNTHRQHPLVERTKRQTLFANTFGCLVFRSCPWVSSFVQWLCDNLEKV